MWTAGPSVIPSVCFPKVPPENLPSVSEMMIQSKMIVALRSRPHRHPPAVTVKAKGHRVIPVETPTVLHPLELATSVDQGALSAQGFQHLMSRPARGGNGVSLAAATVVILPRAVGAGQ